MAGVGSPTESQAASPVGRVPAHLDPVELAQWVNKKVFLLLQMKLGDKVKLKKSKSLQVVDAGDMEDHTDPYKLESQSSEIKGVIKTKIRVAYKIPGVLSPGLAGKVATKATAYLVKQFGVKEPTRVVLTPEEVEQLQKAFTKTEYMGDAHIKFGQYLRRCWVAYNPDQFKAPYVTVVQSSGFGKSRMLRELAKDTNDPDMKVLYMCMRETKSTGYPEATRKLREWLFKEDSKVKDISRRLKTIYHYAIENWGNVQNEWVDLFTEASADAAVAKMLKKSSKRSRRTTSVETELPEIQTKTPGGKMVVLVIDEARSLLQVGSDNGLNLFRKLRRALKSANKDIDGGGGVFGVLVDTNSKISDLSPPWESDPSFKVTRDRPTLFPPFVLTHTMDANWHQYCRDVLSTRRSDIEEEKKEENDDAGDEVNGEEGKVAMEDQIAVYKRLVTMKGKSKAQNALIRMGRPMWYSTFRSSKRSTRLEEAVNLAARKLMLGWGLEQVNYKEETMFGVASMLCRLGIRPYPTSVLASRVVADFMAILAYVNYEMDGYLSTYSSDPVLTLGAIKVWYELDNGLAKYILPQLRKLILSETLDTGGVGEMVARILLLLAMDKCVLGDGDSPNYHRIGQFVFVSKFLEMLGVTDIPIRAKGMGDVSTELNPAFEEWQSKWRNWYVGFTHFVQLSLEPNEDTLWYLLGRRAAGIFPRNQDGADLILPILRKSSKTDAGMDQEDVSFIVVQVKNRHNDDEFSQAATKKFTSVFIFGDYIEEVESKGEQPSARRTKRPGENPLSHKPIHDVIRVYMNVGDDDTRHFRFLYATELADNFDLSSDTRAGPSESTGMSRSETGESSQLTGRDETILTDDNERSGAAPRRDGGSTSLKKTRQVSQSMGEDLALSPPVFTLCFRSICCDAYPFLKKKVVARLASMVETCWDPIALVKGNLTHRAEEDGMKKVKTGASKVILSNLVSRKELEKTATIALVDAPGFDRKAVRKTAKLSQGILMKRPRTQDQQKVSKRVKREVPSTATPPSKAAHGSSKKAPQPPKARRRRK